MGDRYRKSCSDGRSRTWATIVYPESAPSNWIEILSDLKIPCFISPLHNNDLNANGEKKKEHFHVLFLFDSVKSKEQMSEIFPTFGGVGVEKCVSARGYARYLCHLDNPEKAQYSPNDVICLMGTDYSEVICSPSDRLQIIRDMTQYIKANRIHYFNRFFDYCAENNETWFIALNKDCGWIIKEYIKSLTYEDMSDI